MQCIKPKCANSTSIDIEGFINVNFLLRSKKQGKRSLNIDTVVCKQLPFHCILGLDFVNSIGLVIDGSNRTLRYGEKQPASKCLLDKPQSLDACNAFIGTIYNNEAVYIKPNNTYNVSIALEKEKTN